MIGRRKKIVLYFPQLADPRKGVPASKDLLPLSVLTIAGWPDREGYEVVVVDGNLFDEETAHRRVVEACEGALCYGTSGILGYQVGDALRCSRRVRAAHPHLAMVIGGWFASAAPELELETGLYDAVCVGQGEITFREILAALEAGEPLDGVAGLALLRDGQMVRTAPRAVVGWGELADTPWHLIDIAPYREAQLAGRPRREAERMVTPPGHHGRPYFGISYYSSFGCPEPCTFCTSPGVSGLRWKAMPAERMVEELAELHQRWGFDTVRFYDANWGVMEKRSRTFAQGLLERGTRFWWYPLVQSSSVVRYEQSTLEAMRDAGCYVVQFGGETGDPDMLRAIGKHTREGANVEAARRLDRLGICSLATYIIGYPGESAAAMLATLDEARRIAAECPLSRAAVWPYRPLPGTGLWQASLEAGYRPPADLETWGRADEYQFVDLAWPGQLPPEVARARRMYEHFATLSLGLARGRIGWWERRAQRRMSSGDFRGGRLEAKAFDLCTRLSRLVGASSPASEIEPGHQTSVLSGRGAEA